MPDAAGSSSVGATTVGATTSGATTAGATVAPDGDRPDLRHVRLHVVTGKGGTGKTSVAAALALALASTGRKVLVAEVEGRQGLSQTFDVPPLPDHEQLVVRVAGGGEIWGISVDPKSALIEYLDLFYKLGRAGKALEKVGAIDFATTIAPGVRDVLSVGKVYEAVRRRDRTTRGTDQVAWTYDAVLLDAPPTGRVVPFLGVGHEVADLARVGPIRAQAEAMSALLRSRVCAVHVVTLLEEMPVQEAADAIVEIDRAGLRVGAVVVNQVHDTLLSDEDWSDAAGDRSGLAADLARAGLPHDDATVTALEEEARAHLERRRLEDEQLSVVDGWGREVFLLPFLPDGVDAESVRTLARALADQAVW